MLSETTTLYCDVEILLELWGADYYIAKTNAGKQI